MPTHTDVTTLDVGTPPSSGDEKWKSVKLLFHGFGELSAERGQYISSPEFECNGRKWCVLLYPRGSTDASEGYVSIYLKLRFEGSCAVTFEFTSIKVDGSSLRKFADTYTLHNQKNWGWHNFIKRSDILDESRSILDSNGTYAVMISMKEELANNVQPFVPRNDFNCMMRGLFLDEETSDICFEVGATDVEEGNFHAHRLVLKKCAPMLVFDSFNTLDGDEMARVVITDVEPKVFRHLLAYVYGGTVPNTFLKEHAKDFINAADKYSIVNLKLEAEAAFVNSTTITMENVMDNLLFADAKNCAFLKETVMDFLAENHDEAVKKVSFSNVPGHLMKDLLVAVGMSKREGEGNEKEKDLDVMRVSELRRKLSEMGLEVDGSREAMIEALNKTAKRS